MPERADEELTTVLQAAQAGDNGAASSLLPLVYRELRRLAARRLAGEPAGQTLQATALVHEAYLRLVKPEGGAHWENRAHFFAAAARAMRCILIDRARARKSQKRGGAWQRLGASPELGDDEASADREDLLALDEALTRLEKRDPRKAQIVMLRYFGGQSIEDVARLLQLSPTTVKDEWAFARAWLQSELRA